MPEPWTGQIVGTMHVEGITYDEVAAEMGVTKAYISMLLSNKRNPVGAKERLERAVDNIRLRRKSTS